MSRASITVRVTMVAALATVIFLPVYVTFVSAFMPAGQLAEHGLRPDFSAATTDNIVEATRAIPLVRQYLVSLGVVTVQSVGALLTAALAAYAFVFPRWRGRGIAFGIVLFTMAIPGEALVIPNYELVSDLGLRNTILGVAIPFLAAGYPIFLLRQAFRSLPFEMWEAAQLDGCGDLRTLVGVIIPACRPQIATAGLWCALGAWNGYFWPLLITDSAQARTVQVGLAQLVSSENTSPGVIFAGTAIVLVPTIILVVFSQRLLVSSLARGVLR